MNDILKIGNREFSSRLFVGTGKFPSPDIMLNAIKASGSQMITVAMKRVNMMNEATDDMLTHINRDNVQLLPNTSGVRNAKEAVIAAKMSREIFGTGFIKLEIHPDPKYLMPDPIETIKATEELAADGFTVLPYIQADPVLMVVVPLACGIPDNRVVEGVHREVKGAYGVASPPCFQGVAYDGVPHDRGEAEPVSGVVLPVAHLVEELEAGRGMHG